MEIHARNTNTLAPSVYQCFRARERSGQVTQSRNGPVVRMGEPVLVRLLCPWERVNLSPVRDANPFFHLFEALAMLAGFNSARLMAYFARQMMEYSDDGKAYNAFYGTRARESWGDQLLKVIYLLRRDPATRQAVVQLWDPWDLDRTTKDKACNLCMIFRVDERERLSMTTYNRSNDAVKGFVTGANIVHLSMFQEYVALAIGREMGDWWHCANDLHVYTEDPVWRRLSTTTEEDTTTLDYYARTQRTRIPLMPTADHRDTFDEELNHLIRDFEVLALEDTPREYPHNLFHMPFLAHVAVPMFNAWQHHRLRDYPQAIFWAQCCSAEDWSYAAEQWLKARYRSWAKKQVTQ